MCATPLLTVSSSGNRRGQETQSSWAQNKRNSETIQRREPKPGLVNIHLIPPSRKSRESGASESWWFIMKPSLKGRATVPKGSLRSDGWVNRTLSVLANRRATSAEMYLNIEQ